MKAAPLIVLKSYGDCLHYILQFSLSAFYFHTYGSSFVETPSFCPR